MINIFLSDVPNGICKEVVCKLITVETPVMNPYRLTFRAAPKKSLKHLSQDKTQLKKRLAGHSDMQMRTAANKCGSQTSGLWSIQVHVTPASLNRRHERVTLQERVSLESQPSHMKKGVLKNSAQNSMQIRKNSRNLCHLSPIILLITSHCERLPLSTGSLIIHCICPHFPQSNQ